MTRDEILNMPAGPEMDALIAKHVFGFELSDMPGKHKQHGRNWPIPYYSTEIGDAWEVVEKLYRAKLDYYPESSFAYLEEKEGGDPDATGLAEANTMPLAVCRAALLAVMEKYDARDR